MKIEKYLKQVLSHEDILSKTKDKKVYYIHAKVANPPYIEYMILSDSPVYYDDNTEKHREYNIQVDIFSKGDFIELKDTVIKHMLDNGFERGITSPDMYEENTGLYHKALRFSVESFIFED